MVIGGWCKHLKYGSEIDLRKHILSENQTQGGSRIYGFPMCRGNWCNSNLKMAAIRRSQALQADGASIAPGNSRNNLWVPCVSREEEIGVPNSRPEFSDSPLSPGADKNTVVQYLGIAMDEPKRLARLDGITKVSPLAAIGWTEADCRKWCEENDLLSPIYTTATRGGCWFCHNQSIGQLRLLRKNYPDLWALLLKWDKDSPVSFHPDGRTVHDFDRRFQLEDEGKVPTDRTFRWKMLED